MATKREYLRSLGFTVGDRGRFAPDALKALSEAPAGSWDEPVVPVKAETSTKPSQAVKVDRPKSNADPKTVRAWAKDNGHKVGERGRIHPDVFAAYEKAMSDSGETVVERKPANEYFGETAQPFYPVDTQWQHVDAKGKRWVVSGKTACASGVSLAYCPDRPEHKHLAVVNDVRLGLVEVIRQN